jgi:hypothetical protein
MIFGVNYQDILDVPSLSILGNNTEDISDAIPLTPHQVRILIGVYSSEEIDSLLQTINQTLEDHTHLIEDITDITAVGSALISANTVNEQRVLLGFNEFFNATLTSIEGGYAYYGGLLIDGDWKINRFDATDYQLSIATIVENPLYTTLIDAWENRSDLIYL